MKTLKAILVAFIILTIAPPLDAQTVRFSIKMIEGLPDSLDLGGNDTLTVSVKNVDTLTYIGTISFNYSINGIVYSFSDSINAGGLKFDHQVKNLPPGDSVNTFIYVNVKSPVFMSGPSVVVIWPISLGGNHPISSDTARVELKIVDRGTSTADINDSNIGIYYYEGRICLRNPNNSGLKYVRIYNEIGMLVYADKTLNKHSVSLPPLPAGIYFADVVLADNRTKTLKFYKPSE